MKKYLSAEILFLFVACVMTAGTLCFAQETSFVYGDHNRRDPFWPLLSPSGAILSYDNNLDFSDVVLEGIIYDPKGDRFAIINSKVVKMSDNVGGFLVVLIEKDRVVLSKDGQEFILRSEKEK